MTATLEGLNPDFMAKIQAMIAASHGRLHIESGYRDNALQARLYDAAVEKYGATNARKWVAPPGHSNHNKGLAVDLGGDIGLAHQLAPQFGLEFPMSWEPWHIEPVGLREHGQTHPDAYTQGPPGSVSPKDDPLLNTTTSTILARLAAVLSGDPSGGIGSGTAVRGFADPENSGPLGPRGITGPNDTIPAATGTVPLQKGQAGGDPRIPGHSIRDWAKDVLSGMGVPVTDQNLDVMVTWANTESGGYNPNSAGGRYNPLNTTEGALGYVGQGGSQGNIKDFGTYEQGVAAQVRNLTKTKGAGYEDILSALHAGDPQQVFHAIDQSAFGTHFGRS